MRKLREYLDRTHTTQNAFARSLGVSNGYLSQIMHDKRQPGRSLIFRIERATGGEVSFGDWKPESQNRAA